MTMGQVELKLSFYNQGSAQAISKAIYPTGQQGRFDAMQSAIIEKEVIQCIATRLANQGLGDLELCLGPLFVKSK